MTADLNKTIEEKNQLFEKLLAEKDSKTTLIQEFANQGVGLGAATGGGAARPTSAKAKKQKSPIHNTRTKEVEMPMEKVPEENSVHYSEEESVEEEAKHISKHGSDSEFDEQPVEVSNSSSEAKSEIYLDVVED